MHAERGRSIGTANVVPNAAMINEGSGGVGLENISITPDNMYTRKGDWSLPAAGQFATYPVGVYPHELTF